MDGFASSARAYGAVTRAVSRRASNYAGYRVCTRGIRMGQRACPSISRAARHGTSRRKNLITILGRVSRHRCREIYQRERNREFTRLSSLLFFSLSSHTVRKAVLRSWGRIIEAARRVSPLNQPNRINLDH